MHTQCSESIKIDLLCPQGPSQSFKYPSKQNISVVPYSDVLIKVNPRTVTGRTYTISKQESKTATDKSRQGKSTHKCCIIKLATCIMNSSE